MSSAEFSTDDSQSSNTGARLESAIERFRNANSSDRDKLAEELFHDDRAGRILVQILGSAWHEDSSADELTRTIDSGSSNSESNVSGSVSVIGKYSILRKLGQGGMGTVYEAIDAFDSDAQPVALKTIHAGCLEDDSSRQRFVREMQTLAKVQHENIVPILNSGAENGVPFFTMPLVYGEDFAQRIQSNNSEVPGESELLLRARIVEQSCHAVAHIHEAGYLHRDIKPANILLRSSDGRALLSDFGIAKLVGDDSDLTRTDAVVGTLNYASPEQIWNSSTIDIRSDIYSLGVTLYAALTGIRPFGEGKSTEIALRVKNSRLPPIRSINPVVSDALATACHRAIEKHPDDRYQTAAEFACDLNLAINGRRPLLAPISRLGRVGRDILRNPVRSSFISIVGILTCLAVYFYATRPAYFKIRVQPQTANVQIAEISMGIEGGEGGWQGAPGQKLIHVTAEGYETQDVAIMLTRGRGNVVTRNIQLISLRGRIEFDSIPSGAAVSVEDSDGNALSNGKTPYRSPELPSGLVNIKVSAPLFKPSRLEQSVPKSGETKSLKPLRLEPAFSKEMGSPLIGECLLQLDRPFEKPIVANQIDLVTLARHVADATNVRLFIDESSLKRASIPIDLKLDINANSLNEVRRECEKHQLALYPDINGVTPTDWKVISYKSSQSNLLHGIFSLEELNPRLTVRHTLSLITSGVNSQMWEQLGGPFSLGSVEGSRAISVIADIDTHLQVRDYLQELSDFGKSRSADGDSERNVWSDQISIGTLHSVVDAFPLDIAVQPTVLLGDKDFTTAMEFLDEDRLIWGRTDASLTLWDTRSGEQIQKFEAANRPIRCIVRVPGHPEQFVIGDGRGEMARYAADSEQSLDRQWRHRGNLNCIAFSVDEKYMFSSGGDGSIVRYLMPELKHDKTGQMRDAVTSMVALSRYDKGYIALNRTEHEDVWTIDQETLGTVARTDCSDPIGLLVSLPETPTKRAFVFKGRRSMVAGTLIIGGTQISSWSTPGLAAKTVAESLPMNVKAIATLPDDKLIVTVHSDGRVIFRDQSTLVPQAVLRMPQNSGPHKICVSPNGKKLAISRWNVEHPTSQAVILIYNLVPAQD